MTPDNVLHCGVYTLLMHSSAGSILYLVLTFCMALQIENKQALRVAVKSVCIGICY